MYLIDSYELEYLAINYETQPLSWLGRELKSNSKSALFHLVNTLIEHFDYRPELLIWLKQPFIQDVLDSSFFRYDGTAFGDRISMAEHNLRALKAT